MRRQARLRPEYAEWYPRVVPAQWQPAATVRRLVLRQLRRGSPYWQPGPRILSDQHFDFRDDPSAGFTQVFTTERRVTATVPLRSPMRVASGDWPEPDGSSQ